MDHYINTPPKFIVVIGGSAGGLNALIKLVQHFETGKDVAYCIVLHLSRKATGDFVVQRIQQVTPMECSLAEEGTILKKGHIYVARPNQHMLVKNNKIKLGAGPEENRWRPSIDVLFRSAAVAYSSHCIGVILSGLLDDGTSGMWAIKRSGGYCIAQDPNQAEFPDMPLSVINNMEVDHIAPLQDIGALISNITDNTNNEGAPVPEDVMAESKIAEKTAVGIDDVRNLGGLQSAYACPDCGGGLWETQGDVVKRYRCHIGHAYTERDLVLKQAETAGTTLWVALRMMEERKHLLRKLELEYKERGHTHTLAHNAAKQMELEGHINKLKEILGDLQNFDAD